MGDFVTVRDLFNFIYSGEEKRTEMFSLLEKAEFVKDNRILLTYSLVEKKDTDKGLNQQVNSGYFVFYKYAHYDDELFIRFDNFEEADKEYESVDIHEEGAFEMEKRLLKASDGIVEQIKIDKWKD